MNQASKGFTIAELLVVVLVVSIILGVITVFIDPIERVKMSRDSRRQLDLQSLKQALDLALADVEIDLVNGTWNSVTDGTNITNGYIRYNDIGDDTSGLEAYLSSLPLPSDPLESNAPNGCAGRGYIFSSNGQSYEINACLETPKYQTEVGAVDGGNDPAVYEVGNDPGLDLLTLTSGT